jgi:signal transduction histidine kinase/DNA-binding response OmpR family regulator
MLGKLKLGTKFTLLLTLIFLAGIVLSGITLSRVMRYEIEKDVTTKAEILMQAMNSVRNYTTNNIEPLLENRLATQSEFIPEIVPAFAARKVFEQFRDRPEYKSYIYKEAALNPTNPQNRADEFETDLVKQFRIQPELTKLSGYRTDAEEPMFFIAKPLAVNQTSCLECHGSQSAAPKSTIATYGTQGGFNWKLNEVVAAQTIYVPANEVFARERHYLTLVMGIFAIIFMLVVLPIERLLKQTVIHPIKRLTESARQISTGTMTTEKLEAFDSSSITQIARRADEPGELARAFQHMAREVAARELNLTRMVKRRTAQLAKIMQEAEQARAKAEEANKAKSQFLSNMSHELRTPLNVILGFTQLLARNGSLAPQQQEYLGTIDRSGEHLLALINDVLEMAKIEAGKIVLNENNFDLYSLLNWLQQMFRLKAESKGLQLIFDLSPDLPRYIRTDESKLRQVLVNLLGNAIKFTQAGSVTLRVSSVLGHGSLVENNQPRTHDKGQMTIHFEVEDTGPGIAPEELKSLFEPFVQAEAGRHSQQGTGLGLPISREYVRLMGGEISVESRLGEGTIFLFDIQIGLVKADELQGSQQPSRQVIGLEAGQPPYRILIAEDKPENRRLLVELLAPVGFEIREATNGQEAIALWQSWSPHLIWMDIRMPVMDGLNATKQIKATGEKAPIIIALTASAFEEDRLAALSAGCDDFVRKPFRVEVIFEKMAQQLGVRYRYGASQYRSEGEENSSVLSQLSRLQLDEIAVALAAMPPEWVEQLHQAAIRVNAKQILLLVEQIPQSVPHLANALTYLVNNFRFEEIITLTQQQ